MSKKSKPGGGSLGRGVQGSGLYANHFTVTEETTQNRDRNGVRHDQSHQVPRYRLALTASWTTSSIASATRCG